MAYIYGDKKPIFLVSNKEVRWERKATDLSWAPPAESSTYRAQQELKSQSTFSLGSRWYRKSIGSL